VHGGDGGNRTWDHFRVDAPALPKKLIVHWNLLTEQRTYVILAGAAVPPIGGIGTGNDFAHLLAKIDADHPVSAAPPKEYDECPDAEMRAKIRECSKAAAGCLTYTEFRILEYKLVRDLTLADTDELIQRIKDPRFNPAELRTDSTRTLQGWANKASHVKHREINVWRPGDGDQQLVMWLRSIEDVVRRVMADPALQGYIYMGYEPMSDSAGNRIFGPVNSGLFFQITQSVTTAS
jgi:hypothetical protein